MSSTSTYTSASSRFNIIMVQVVDLLTNAALLPSSTIQKVKRGLQEPHYVCSVSAQGLLKDGTIGAEVGLSIDWRAFAVKSEAGGYYIKVPPAWEKLVAGSQSAAIEVFNSACAQAGFNERAWTLGYQSQFVTSEVDTILGFKRGQVRNWARPSIATTTFGYGPLSELQGWVKLI